MKNIQEKLPETEGPVFNVAELEKAKKFVSAKVAKGQKGFPFIQVLDISPEIAAVLLQRNPADENRKLSPTVVSKYARDMAGGRWQGLNGQTIVISSDGYLNDGQHRLNAIIEAEKTIQLAVVFGAERESRLTLDQNKVRSSGDYLTMTGIKNGSNVATTASLVMAISSGKHNTSPQKVGIWAGRDAPTKAQIHDFAVANLKTIELAYDAIGHNWKQQPCPPSRSTAALILIYNACKDWDAACDFINACLTGENVTKTSPAYQARERMISEKIAGGCPPVRTMEIFFRSWNAHRLDKRMRRIALKGKLPELEA